MPIEENGEQAGNGGSDASPEPPQSSHNLFPTRSIPLSRGLPPDMNLMDWIVHWTMAGGPFHRRADQPGDRVKFQGEEAVVLRIQDGSEEGDEPGFVRLDRPVHGFTGWHRDFLDPA